MLEKFIRCGAKFSALMSSAKWGTKMDARTELCKLTGIGQSQSYVYQNVFSEENKYREAITEALSDGRSVNIAKALEAKKSEKTKSTERAVEVLTIETEGDVRKTADIFIEALATENKEFLKAEEEKEARLLKQDIDKEYMAGIPIKQIDHLRVLASKAPVDLVEQYNGAYKAYRITFED